MRDKIHLLLNRCIKYGIVFNKKIYTSDEAKIAINQILKERNTVLDA